MVTTRSQDKMTFADRVRANALDVDLARTQVWLTGLYVAVRAEIKSARHRRNVVVP